jgi:hypothetical protein
VTRLASLWTRRSARRRSPGQTLVEFALVIGIFLVMILALFDFGRAVFGTSSLGNAARMGARTAIVNQNAGAIRSRAADQAVALGLDRSAVACTAGTPTSAPTPTGDSGTCVEFRTTDLSGTCSSIELGCIAVVTTKWTYIPITPVAGQLFGQIALTSTSRMPIESICTSGGCPVP